MAEAGFCYAQGIGCKKNLKKSSKFYREAEAKGMSMVGNSWYVLPRQSLTMPTIVLHLTFFPPARIYKSKYNDDKESIKSPKFSKEEKARSKSRSRNIFGMKHSS